LVAGEAAAEFVYAISADRGTSLVADFVMQAALEAWARANGRALTNSEEYAVTKMRLFQAFDEGLVPLTAKRQVRRGWWWMSRIWKELLEMLNI